ncbi:hypothetical protein Lepto7376_4339 [[Leptolyngbya] sp. PCC 7376]|uniref:hypothetical protein n=1 Tax=[Leptolyngbya] sp. PCC 7376 TaxID=111781 RepID=UPI00029F34B5|nr:hypothetical protein [[Leptolyngbya] sp. PCC 7376]AFY40447.1 hypothetical protein Lepto7376_4339 [[Leptolyngbya] sp. PCC 7376]
MGFIQNVQAATQKILGSFVVFVCLFSLWGCGDRSAESAIPQFNTQSEPIATPQLTEVAPPSLITQLREDLAQYQPQVKIISPQPNEILQSSRVAIELEVKDLPLFKDPDLEMGPHLHLFIDDQPYRAVYDVSEPIIFEDLNPGSHLIRVFASRPWHESFKNEGAYAQTTFSVFTENNTRLPNFSEPLLTYSRPQGTYGAEPIMLDFYLTNAPLHFVAQADEEDSIADWRIRATVNGESFILDNWQPIYLEGFKKGENWLKLEFVDSQGELVDNVYNNPVRVINYDPQLNDTLAKLVKNKISLRSANKIISTKELPPEPEVEVIELIEPEVTEPETTEEQDIEIIDLDQLSPEPEILESEQELDINADAEDEFEEEEETSIENIPAIAPNDLEADEATTTDGIEAESAIEVESEEVQEEDSLEDLEEIESEATESLDTDIEVVDESPDNTDSEVSPTPLESDTQEAEANDVDEENVENIDTFWDLDATRTTDVYADDIRLEP